jgi:hypothetical protein
VEIQPESIEFHSADDVFVKSMHIKHAGILVPQHSHSYDHLSMLARGSVRVWKDDVLMGEFKAPHGINIEANCKHRFLSLEPDTIIYCIHNTSRNGEVEIAEHHELRR